MQVCFDHKWSIRGCIIQDYLLEQSRITFQSPGERNYHVMYQLVAEGCTNKELAQTLHLREPRHFRYLFGGGGGGTAACSADAERLDIDVPAETKRFEALRLAFTVLQMTPEIIEGTFKVLSAILWLGNMDFEVSGA